MISSFLEKQVKITVEKTDNIYLIIHRKMFPDNSTIYSFPFLVWFFWNSFKVLCFEIKHLMTRTKLAIIII